MLHECINQIVHIMVVQCEQNENKLCVNYDQNLPVTIFSDYNRI